MEQIGIVVSAWTLAHALVQPLAGVVADRYGTPRVFAVALTIMAIGAVAFSAAVSLPALAASRFILGIGTGAAFVSGLRAIGVAGESRSLTVVRGVYGATVNIGYAGALLIVPLLYATMGWTNGILLQAVVPILLAIAGWTWPLRFPEEVTHPRLVPGGERQSRNYRTAAMAIAHFVGNGMAVTIVTWGVEFIRTTYGGSVAFSSLAVTVASMVGFAGRLASGRLLSAVGSQASILISMVLTALGLVALGFSDERVSSITLLVLVGLACNLSFAAAFSPEGSLDSRLGGEMGFISFAGNLGSFVMIALIGLIVGRTGGFETVWTALAACTVLSIMAILLVWWKQRAAARGKLGLDLKP